ncbi:hypothetical protein [Flavobacterium yafengii]|uniref:hypothetical protein n=1 Tax=Flavobacterium yafengii TaxID=3041253 RepID=UPI0024A88250|nr:hypothetical protein [Flavobacterium yafengii]MDI5898635.1 hypothetical protein [Flavobacterium yafengii]
MEERILLSTYVIKIIDGNKNNQYLSNFNGSDDFLKLFDKFSNYIFENINQLKDKSGRNTIHLTLEEKPILNDEKRYLYGFFSSGIGGEKYRVKDITTNTTVLNVNKNHAAFRDVFFYLYIPKNKSIGYLILQRKNSFGIKTKLSPALNAYISKEGFLDYYISINNIVHHSVYRKMMDFGKLKKVELVKRKIPNNLEDYVNNNENYQETKGTFRTSFSSRSSLPEHWKEYIDKLLKKEKNETVEIEGLDENFSDLEFQLDLNGKQKTFYVKNQQRTQPDIDVTANIIFVDDSPTVESLIQQSQELINDLIEIRPKNV